MTQAREHVESPLKEALEAPDQSVRLQAALSAGTIPDPALIPFLIERCAVESDFYVRDMLTWALIRHDHASVLEWLLPELESESPQARSQALHTLTKIDDPDTWPAITRGHLQDDDDRVARTAWRAAAGLVPEGQKPELAETLATQFDRGDPEVQLSLSRALALLGPAAAPSVERAKSHQDEGVRTHAFVTERIIANPEEGFETALAEARKVVALLGAPMVEG